MPLLMSIGPEIAVAPLLVALWLLGEGVRRQFPRMQQSLLGRADPQPWPRSLTWAWRAIILALAVLWAIGLVRRFG